MVSLLVFERVTYLQYPLFQRSSLVLIVSLGSFMPALFPVVGGVPQTGSVRSEGGSLGSVVVGVPPERPALTLQPVRHVHSKNPSAEKVCCSGESCHDGLQPVTLVL